MKNTYQFFESFKKKKRFDKYRSIFSFYKRIFLVIADFET